MNRPFAFKVGIQINSGLPTKPRGVAFSAMHCAAMGIPIAFISGTSRPHPSMSNRSSLLFMHVWWGCLTALMTSLITASWTTCTHLRFFFRGIHAQENMIVPWCRTKRWSWSTFLCCSREGTKQEGAREVLWNSKGSRYGWWSRMPKLVRGFCVWHKTGTLFVNVQFENLLGKKIKKSLQQKQKKWWTRWNFYVWISLMTTIWAWAM